jgi:hypothetical protein
MCIPNSYKYTQCTLRGIYMSFFRNSCGGGMRGVVRMWRIKNGEAWCEEKRVLRELHKYISKYSEFFLIRSV